LADGTGSLINNITIPGNLVVSGTLYAQNTVTVTQSFSSGSNILGDAVDDFQTLYGTVRIPTGSLTITGSTNISGSVTAKGVFVSTDVFPTGYGFITVGSAVQSVGFYTNVWRGAYSGALYSYVANAYTSSVDNLILAGTRPSNPAFAQFQLYVKTDNTTVLNTGGGGPILDIAANATPYSRFDGTNFSIGTTSALARLHSRGTGTTSTTTAFRVENANASASLVVLDDGNVGIGTSTPSQLLDINAGSAASALVKFTAGSGVNRAQVGFLTGYGAVVGATSGNSIFVHGTNIMFRSHDLLTEWMRINNSGVGIGTTSISASLHISGSPTATLLQIDSPNSSSIVNISGSGNLGFGQVATVNAKATFRGKNSYTTEINTVSNGSYGVRTDGPVKAGGFYFGNSSGNIASYTGVSILYFDTSNNVGLNISSSLQSKFHIRGAGTTSATTALRVDNLNNTASLVVLDNGRVGIGVTTPSNALEVNGAAIISGSITQRGSRIFMYDTGGNGGGSIYGGYTYLNGEVFIQPLGGLNENFIFSPTNGMSIGGFTMVGRPAAVLTENKEPVSESVTANNCPEDP